MKTQEMSSVHVESEAGMLHGKKATMVRIKALFIVPQ
jgi:hypothetical protein